MKIAMVCTEKLPVPAVAGGAVQIYIEGILPYVSRHHQITVFNIQHPSLPAQEIRDDVRYIRVAGKNAAAYAANINPLLAEGFDLVHVFNRPASIMKFASAYPDQRFSLSLHNEMFHPEKINDAAGLECIRRVEFINTVSDFIAEGVRQRFPSAADKLHVVYSGADPVRYVTASSEKGKRSKLELQKKYNLQGRRVILFVGRLSEKKGTHILLKAMKEVGQTHPHTALVIIGSKWYGKNEVDDYTRQVQQLAETLEIPVIFTGFLTPDQVSDHFNLGDIFVCASQWQEPLARVHYEAMAAALPIITTRRGGNAEVMHHQNGIVIDDYRNPQAFASSIRYLLDNPRAAAEMGHNGRMAMEEHYHWARVAEQIFLPVEQHPAMLTNRPFTPVLQPAAPEPVPILRKKSSSTKENNSTFTFDFDF